MPTRLAEPQICCSGEPLVLGTCTYAPRGQRNRTLVNPSNISCNRHNESEKRCGAATFYAVRASPKRLDAPNPCGPQRISIHPPSS